MKWKMSDTSEKEYIFPYWGPFIMETYIDRELVDLLLEKGVEAKLDARKDLAGQMNKEFYYENYEDWFTPKFSPYMDLYTEGLIKYLPTAFTYLYGTCPLDFQLLTTCGVTSSSRAISAKRAMPSF